MCGLCSGEVEGIFFKVGISCIANVNALRRFEGVPEICGWVIG